MIFHAACPVHLGMESGAILDSQISASSFYNYGSYFPHQARLHFKAGGGKAGCWSSRYLDSKQWLQVDLLQTTRVTGVATQGRNGGASQWVQKYKLQYRDDGQTFKFYRRSGDSSPTVWYKLIPEFFYTSCIAKP